MESKSKAENDILELEYAALDKWAQGNVHGFIEISAEDISYFDPKSKHRINGRNAFINYLLPFNGKWKIPKYKIVDPQVRSFNEIVLLTFILNNYSSLGILTSRWKATEIYRKKEDGWELIHSHWSQK